MLYAISSFTVCEYEGTGGRSDVRCKEKGRVGEDFPCPGVKGLNIKYANHLSALS